MSTVNGFQVGSETLKYNYESLENYNTPEFSTTKAYAVGDYVIYQGKLYKCTTAVTTAGSWSSSNWTLAILSDDVSSINNAIGDLERVSTVFPELVLSNGYVASNGDIASASSSKEKYSQNIYNVVSCSGTLTYPSTNALWVGIGEYRSDGSFIRRDTFTKNADSIDFDVSVNPECDYIIISFRSYGEYTSSISVLQKQVKVDATLTVEGAAADAEVTGEKISTLKSDVTNLYDGKQYLTNFVIGGINNDGTFNPTPQNSIISEDWFTVDYPLSVSVDDGYQYRLWFNDGGTVSFASLVTSANLLYPNRQTKIYVWKKDSYAALDLEDTIRKFHVQTVDDYLAKRSGMLEAKANNGYTLFPGFLRRGGLNANGVYVDYVVHRCATPYIASYTRDITITSNTGYRFAAYLFNDSDVYQSETGWKTSYTISAGQKFRLLVAKTTEDSSVFADANEFIQQLNVSSAFTTRAEFDNMSIPMLKRGFLQNGGKPHLAAHTGYHASYPGNSNPAFEAAGKNMFWGIESDANQTSDGYIVMIHDTTVDSTTDGTGAVNSMTLAQIRALHLTNTQYQVPTLEEFLGICKRYSCVPIIEIKGTITSAGIEKIVKTLKDFGLDSTSILIGSKWNFNAVRAKTTEIPYLSVYQNVPSTDFDTELAYNAGYANSGLDWDYTFASTVSLEKAEAIHDAGMLFGTFTIDNAADVATAFAAGVDFVTTNSVLPYANN